MHVNIEKLRSSTLAFVQKCHRDRKNTGVYYFSGNAEKPTLYSSTVMKTEKDRSGTEGLKKNSFFFKNSNFLGLHYYLRIMLSILPLSAFALDDSLVAYWSFDEGIGNIAVDSARNNLNGKIYGNPEWKKGIKGKALYFDGNTFVDCGNSPLLEVKDKLTIEMWVLNDEWWPGISYDYDGFQELIFKSGEICLGFYSSTVEPNIWHHIIFIIENDKIYLYIDGYKIKTLSVPKKIPISNNGHFLINGKNSHLFKGLIDEVRIYSKVLSEKEILAHYTEFKKEALKSFPTKDPDSNIKVTDYPASMYVKSSFPALPVTIDTARSATWGSWGWRPSEAIIKSLTLKNADSMAKKIASTGTNMVFLDEFREIMCNDETFKMYLKHVKVFVDACHKYNMKAIMHLTVTGVLKDYAQANAKQAVLDMETGKGTFFPSYKTYNMCVNNPAFQKAFLVRVEALMKLGLDGLMPDELQWLPNKLSVCGCVHCQKKFKTLYGFSIPKPENEGIWNNYDNPEWRAWRSFRIRSQNDMLGEISKTARKYCKNAIITSCQCNNMHPQVEMVFVEDCEHIKVLTASFYECEPCNIWSWRYKIAESKYYTALTPTFFLEYCNSISQMYFSWVFALTNNLRFWTWHKQQTGTLFPFLWEKKWERLFVRSEPFCNVGIIYSSWVKPTMSPKDAFLAHNEYTGWAEAFTEEHIPFETVMASLVSSQTLGKYNILVLPNMQALSEKCLISIRDYVKNGGTLIITHESSLYNETGAKRMDFGLSDIMGISYVKTSNSSFAFTREMVSQKIYYQGTTVKFKINESSVNVVAASGSKPCIVENNYGKGKVIYLPFLPGNLYYMPKIHGADYRMGNDGIWFDNRKPEYKNLMGSFVNKDKISFETNASCEVIVNAYKHDFDGYKGIIVHLLNTTGTQFKSFVRTPLRLDYEFINYPTVENIIINVDAKNIKKAWLISPDFLQIVELPFSMGKDGKCKIIIPSLSRYSCLYLVTGPKDVIKDCAENSPVVNKIPEALPFPAVQLEN